MSQQKMTRSEMKIFSRIEDLESFLLAADEVCIIFGGEIRHSTQGRIMRHLASSIFLAGGLFVVCFAATFEQKVYHSANAATVFENILLGACGVCLIALSLYLVLIDIRTSQLSLLSQCEMSSRKWG
ncbi:unnamed protein product [Larinioides sclopetarius]|uniref:Uncharacterized protein n=1 Tax=Larinioides sclopetarius TaxID=280406 RepID=A0AAV2BNV7_9ARAC